MKEKICKITMLDRFYALIRKTWLPVLPADPASFRHDVSSCSRKFPKTFTYQYVEKNTKKTYPVLLLSDSNILSWREYRAEKLFGWISESSVIVPEVLDKIRENITEIKKSFVKIFTCDYRIISLSDVFQFSLAAANLPWVALIPKDFKKTKLLSMIASKKGVTEGHLLRDKALLKFPVMDVFGRGRREINKKEEGLYPYMFSIVIENGNYPLYFTEKITDCFASKTIPIYWGTDAIKKYFDPRGILKYNETKPEMLTPEKYQEMLPYVLENYQKIKSIESADDMIFRQIKELDL